MKHRANKLAALVVVAFATGRGAEPGGFAWRKLDGGRVELLDRGAPVLAYNVGPQLKPGAPEDRRRCCYIYPLYTPRGVSMLDDFPTDHWHHRGLFWAWPVVETSGITYDLWMTMTVNDKSQREPILHGGAEGKLDAANVWRADGREIVRERVVLSVYPVRGGSRDLTVKLTLEAIGAPVTLKGSREAGKSYGGFVARFAPRESTVLRADDLVLSGDEDLIAHAWAELEGVFEGRRANLRITPAAGEEGAPHQWCLRNYGFVGVSFPGRTPVQDGYTLVRGKPLRLSFTVRVEDRD